MILQYIWELVLIQRIFIGFAAILEIFTGVFRILVKGVIASKIYLNALMQCRVISQVTIRRESHLTVGTFIWFVSAVDSLVHNQLSAASKTFTT